ncbi:hypothetical protein [Paenibacillus sp. UNC499MF]|uniref:hypothetical protein n=1 Tax=Paenibacillus sp. UNC499MF TaxID=1502751 RepID=UPI0008A01BC0|nr:hypothetical protein [Paenibacillus sp. UNC499MF]SEG09725.1 hypothetical protein SAMN02799616_01844 [Paenibacillus sp. UNC499MF]
MRPVKVKKRLAGLFMLALLAGGCSAPAVTPPSGSPSPLPSAVGPEQLIVEPADLFAGDADKFSPFLGSHAGSVRVRYEGRKKQLNISYKVWENGKASESAISQISLPMGGGDANPQKDYNAEFIVSVHEVRDEKDENILQSYAVMYSLKDSAGSSSSGFNVPVNREHFTQSHLLKLREKIAIPDSTPTAVWGFAASNANAVTVTSGKSPEEEAAKAPYAFVMYLTLE